MKFVKSRRLAVTLILLLCVMAICVFFKGNSYIAKADSLDDYYDSLLRDPYDFEVTHYDITYDIASDCSMDVTEDITIKYKGTDSTGILRDIPINDGAMVQNISVKKIVGNTTQSVYYDVRSEDSDFITLSIGDFTNKNTKSESYRITYKYIVTNDIIKTGELPINAVVHACPKKQSDISVKLILPKGYTHATCFIGEVGSENQHPFWESKNTDGRTVITTYVDYLAKYEGVTFYLRFEDGTLKSYSDPTPYVAIGLGVIILLITLMVRMFVFNKDEVVPVINFEAPESMDPLLMGKLIDNKVDSEDVTSLIYYFADKGYLKINLDDESDPTLIRVVKSLPDYVSQQEKIMFNGLFNKGDMVKTSELRYSFYRTVEGVTAAVNKQAKGLYTGKSQGVSALLALLGGLVAALTPIVLVLTRISSKFFNPIPLFVLIPVIIIYGLGQYLKYNELKFDTGKKLGFTLIMLAIAALTCLIYAFIVPDYVMGKLAKATLCAVGCLSVIVATGIVNRTDSYSKRLGEIVGFRNFILLAEKDRLEKMLEDNPDFYYHVLPYAQVLGVSDKWQQKFRDITVQPPQWATSTSDLDLFDFIILNNLIRHSMSHMTMNMVARPSSSGTNGGGRGFGGGSHGGFSGGGFGGGGIRGR